MSNMFSMSENQFAAIWATCHLLHKSLKTINPETDIVFNNGFSAIYKNEEERPADGRSSSKREGISYWVCCTILHSTIKLVKILGSFHRISITCGVKNVQQKFWIIRISYVNYQKPLSRSE